MNSGSFTPIQFDSPLLRPTASGWAEVALSDIGAFLQDHANCERKASALCMSFVSKYPDKTVLIEPMISLAREELEHFAQVFRILQKRGLGLAPAEKETYVQMMLKAVRSDGDERLLDRLIVSGLIEARSCERLHLVSVYVEDPGLKDFYSTLARSEAGHFRVFFRLAEKLFAAEAVREAIDRLVLAEDKGIHSTPWRCGVH